MTHSEKLIMADFVKFAASLPWSTLSRLNAGEGLPGVGVGLNTDMGRNVGMLGGGILGGIAGGIAGGATSYGPAGGFVGRRLGAGAGALAGGVAGHIIGKKRGKKKFQDKKEESKKEESKKASTFMLYSEKLIMSDFVKRANGLRVLALGGLGGLGAATAVPWSTVSRVSQGQGWRGAGAGGITDMGRDVGILSGGSTGLTVGGALGAGSLAKSLENIDRIDKVAPELIGRVTKKLPGAGKFLALAGGGLLAGATAGGIAGHRGGRAVGERLFRPQNPVVPNAWETMKQKLGFH